MSPVKALKLMWMVRRLLAHLMRFALALAVPKAGRNRPIVATPPTTTASSIAVKPRRLVLRVGIFMVIDGV